MIGTTGILVLSLIIFAFYPIIKFFKSQQFTQAAQPTIQYVFPNIGSLAGGDKVIIQGDNFEQGYGVKDYALIWGNNYESNAGAGGCAIGLDNKIYCWGKLIYKNHAGVLTTIVDSTTPVQIPRGDIPEGAELVKIESHIFNGISSSVCILDSNGKMYCFGDTGTIVGDYPTVPLNTTEVVAVPTLVNQDEVVAGTKIIDIFAGGAGGVALGDDGNVYGWGRE